MALLGQLKAVTSHEQKETGNEPLGVHLSIMSTIVEVHTGAGAAAGCAYGLHKHYQYDRQDQGRSVYEQHTWPIIPPTIAPLTQPPGRAFAGSATAVAARKVIIGMRNRFVSLPQMVNSPNVHFSSETVAFHKTKYVLKPRILRADTCERGPIAVALTLR
jgi:hypothetical protein